MKKIIDHVFHLPDGCETSKFPASFASVLMRIEGVTSPEQVERLRICGKIMPTDDCNLRNDGSKEINSLSKYHEKIHNLYAVVSGISLMQLDLSEASHFEPWWGPNTNKLLEENDDYVKFTMGFAGYTYERFNKKTDKETIFNAIKRSIDADRPVLINFGLYYDWFPVTGYDDETGRLYGYDSLQDSWDKYPAAEGYEDGLFYLSRWYEEMTEVIVITGKTEQSATYDDVFQRMIYILESMLENGYFKRSVDFLRNNVNFENYDDKQYRQLAQRIEMFIGLPMDQRNVTKLCFNNLAQNKSLQDKWQYFKHISSLYQNTLDICWIAWRMVGAFGIAPIDECAKALVSPIVRRAIADLIDIVRKNDESVLSCLRDMMDMMSPENK